MAKPFREGAGWAYRFMHDGERYYGSGFADEHAATLAMQDHQQSLNPELAVPRGGPAGTTLAEALGLYAIQRLPTLKSAPQEAARINRYLRLLGLPLVHLDKLPLLPGERQQSVHYSVTLARAAKPVQVPKSLRAHRNIQASKSELGDILRRKLAKMTLLTVKRAKVQALLDQFEREGMKPASLQLERAVLRQVFNHAINRWEWASIRVNPATGLKLPSVDNARDRVLSNDEWARIKPYLAAYPNPYALAGITLLLETAMRSSEVLRNLRWSDWDPVGRVLVVHEAKAGKRKVPVGPGAVQALEALRRVQNHYLQNPPKKRRKQQPPRSVGLSDSILPTTYEALKKAWKVACVQAKVEGVNLHDLRHTSATRYGLDFRELSTVMVMTGHKTASQAMRYVNTEATQVSRWLHGEALNVGDAPAGMTRREVDLLNQREGLVHVAPPPPQPAVVEDVVGGTEGLPSNVVPFPVRRAA